MTDKSEQDQHDEPIPKMQKLFDRPFLLLILGMAVMLVFYTFWGIWEIVKMPTGVLP